MRRLHFETLRPVCPRCRAENGKFASLVLASVERESSDDVLEGTLHCSDSGCQMEYPIIDGIPLLLPRVRTYISDNLLHIAARDDLSETTESLIGDGVGPGTHFDATRQHLSTYAWDHYADLDPTAPKPELAPGSVARCLESGLSLVDEGLAGPVIDIGCSVGRGAFALAERYEGPVLGVDLNFSMLRLARRVQESGIVRYPLRRVGIVYDRRKFEVRFTHKERVDFWACDALSLPFPDDTFGLVVGLNILDCVTSPRDLLEMLARILRPAGCAVLSTPYDWSPGATPVEAWIGGHSQRGSGHGASEPFVKSLLTPGAHPQSIHGLRMTGEIEEFPWNARIHDRSTMAYKVHLVVAKAEA